VTCEAYDSAGRMLETAGELRGLAEAVVGEDAVEDEAFRGASRVFPPKVASSSSRFTSPSYSGVVPCDWILPCLKLGHSCDGGDV